MIFVISFLLLGISRVYEEGFARRILFDFSSFCRMFLNTRKKAYLPNATIYANLYVLT